MSEWLVTIIVFGPLMIMFVWVGWLDERPNREMAREQAADRERERVWSFLTPEDRAWFAEQGVEHYPESRWSSEWL